MLSKSNTNKGLFSSLTILALIATIVVVAMTLPVMTSATSFYLNPTNHAKYYDVSQPMIDFSQPLIDISTFMPTISNGPLFEDADTYSLFAEDDEEYESDSTVEVVQDIISNGDELLEETIVNEIIAENPIPSVFALTIISVDANQQIVRDAKVYEEVTHVLPLDELQLLKADEEYKTLPSFKNLTPSSTSREIIGSTSAEVKIVSSVRDLIFNRVSLMNDDDESLQATTGNTRGSIGNHRTSTSTSTSVSRPGTATRSTSASTSSTRRTTTSPANDAVATVVSNNQSTTTTSSTGKSAVKTTFNLKAAAALIKSIVVPLVKAYENKSFSVPKAKSAQLGSLTIHSLDLKSNKNGVVTVALDASIQFIVTKKFFLIGTAKVTGTFSHLKVAISSTLSLNQASSRLSLSNFQTVGGVEKANYKVTGKFFAKLLTKIGLAIFNFKKILTGLATKEIPTGIQAAVLTLSDKIGISVPTKLPLTKGLPTTNPLSTLTMSSKMSELTFPYDNVVLVGFDGSIVDGKTMQPYPNTKVFPKNQLVLPYNANHLFQAELDQSLFNNLFSTWFTLNNLNNAGNSANNNNGNLIYTKQTQPSWLVGLTTAMWNTIFPGIGKNYPQSDLLMMVSLSQQPMVTFAASNTGEITINAKVEWFIIDQQKDTKENNWKNKFKLVSIDIKLTTAIQFSTQYNAETKLTFLTTKLTKLQPVFAIDFTVIGPIDLQLVNTTLQNIIDNVLLVEINKVMNQNGGIPIPTSPKLSLKSPSITFVQYGVIVGTGVATLEL